jgi:hypothetical protein
MQKIIKQNSKLLVIALVTIFVLMVIWATFGAHPTINQPIAYNHKLHIEEVELTCGDCHIYVESLPMATIPNISICVECHSEEPLTDSPEEAKLIKYLEEGSQIPWQRIYSVPDHVYFSHRRHVSIGELDCNKCHGHVEELTEPSPYPVWLPSMDNCIDCHKEHKITYDCLACHI